VKRKLLFSNPITGIEVPPTGRVLTYLTREQRKAVYEATRDRAFKNFLTAMQETGCRPSEVAAVAAVHANPELGVWVLPEHKTERKSRKPRTVYLTDAMIALTKELAAEATAGPLFLNSRKRPWTRNAIRCRRRGNSEALGRPLGGGAIVRRTTVPTRIADRGTTTIRDRGALRCTPIWTNGPRSAVGC
jgi:integrase